MESLIKAGAMDSLSGNRAQLTEASIGPWKRGCGSSRDREMGQAGLFGIYRREEEHEYPLAKSAATGHRSRSWPARRRCLAFMFPGIRWTASRIR